MKNGRSVVRHVAIRQAPKDVWQALVEPLYTRTSHEIFVIVVPKVGLAGTKPANRSFGMTPNVKYCSLLSISTDNLCPLTCLTPIARYLTMVHRE